MSHAVPVTLNPGKDVPAQLHSLIHGPRFWLNLFGRHGWVLDHMLEGHNAGLTRAHWECCSYVLVRPSQATANAAQAHDAAHDAAKQAREEVARMAREPWWRDANDCRHWHHRDCRR